MDDVEIDPDRLYDRFEEFNRIGATEQGGVNRPALSDANRSARDRLCEWFREAGLEVTIDEMGNVFGRREGERDDLPPVLIGSHVDSQYNGGQYDGVIGVLGGLEIVEALSDAGERTRRPIEVVSWSNEEGVRFQPDMLGSGVFAGAFDLEFALSRADGEGNTFGEELERIGYAGDEPCRPRDLHCYFELHVEQGPRLERRGLSVAAVEGVYGFAWLSVTFEGMADHAGPTPMHEREDALVAASDVVGAVRRLTASGGEDLVGTVGSLEVEPDAINVIPETVELTVDLRSHDDDVVSSAVDRIRREVEWAAEREGIDYRLEELMRIEPRTFDTDCVETVEAAIEAAGYEGTRLVSGAGHDASYLDDVCPTGMVFVPSLEGVSHRESEFTEWSDVVAGVEVLCEVVRQKAAE
ncbi:beta-ureidopropionase/N-carbamoyl-L-amino-acid hydrolase [Halalkaliarchaeum desulfuricum]|uniref:Beta-ureidopropionase/N-carbamoyl-L-amino-acid hydrolase n=1 Tax=Halalkaliarchaeum desulfuricum TaxID=2055893 RepID=A0A343TM08_9EURY|nr:Zn-dependent hydrolase [Halalkaliarchaeum desulfuricum]AUX10130.1 beta-ureidopropionase/N-carbamoyl-L-amino-acid hydrolase [Halalkaliarchaeum desulfuricum]